MATHKLSIDGMPYEVEVGPRQGQHVQVTVNGRSYAVQVEPAAGAAPMLVRSVPPPPANGAASIPRPAPMPKTSGAASRGAGGEGSVRSPMAGLVTTIKIKPGDAVKNGDEIMVLEAMKMENAITAHRDGIVKAVSVTERQTVSQNDILAELE